MSNWAIPDSLLKENGGTIEKIENPDGSVIFKDTVQRYGVGSYTGPIPTMDRRTDRAGQTVIDGEFELKYDENGYCISMLHLTNMPEKDEDK